MKLKAILRHYGPRLALLGFSCLATLLCLEAALRTWGQHILPEGEWITIGKITRHAPLYGFGLKAGTRQVSVVGGSYAMKASINDQGFRDDVHPVERRPGIARILLLGDSFMFGTGVGQDETLAARLEQMNPRLEVVNTGVPGYDLGMEYLFYESEGARFAPDLVLVGFFVNDVSPYTDLDVTYDDEGVPASYSVKPEVVAREEAETPHGFRGAISSWLRNHSLLFVFARDHLRNLGAERSRARKTIDDQLFAPFRKYGPDDPDNPWPHVYRILDRLKRQVGQHGSRLAVFLVPAAPYQMSPEDFRKWLDWWELGPDELVRTNPQDKILDWCSRSGTDCLDLLEVFEGKDYKDLYLAHDLHWTPEGHLLAAETLSRFIADRGLLEPKIEPSWPSSASTASSP